MTAGAGHFPEALAGLGRVAAARGDAAAARSYLIAALDLTRPPAPEARGPLPLLSGICMELLRLNEPVRDCSAWKTTLPLDPAVQGWSRLAVVIQAADQDAAAAWARWFYACLYPGRDLNPGTLPWKPVEVELPSEVRSRPGMCACWPDQEPGP